MSEANMQDDSNPEMMMVIEQEKAIAVLKENNLEPLSLEQLTLELLNLREQHGRLLRGHNQLAQYVNNLHENPVYVGSMLSHLNELVGTGSVLMVQFAEVIPDRPDRAGDQRATLGDIPPEDAEDRRPEVTIEYFDGELGEWTVVIDANPAWVAIQEAVRNRLILAKCEIGKPYQIQISNVSPEPREEAPAPE